MYGIYGCVRKVCVWMVYVGVCEKGVHVWYMRVCDKGVCMVYEGV